MINNSIIRLFINSENIVRHTRTVYYGQDKLFECILKFTIDGTYNSISEIPVICNEGFVDTLINNAPVIITENNKFEFAFPLAIEGEFFKRSASSAIDYCARNLGSTDYLLKGIIKDETVYVGIGLILDKDKHPLVLDSLLVKNSSTPIDGYLNIVPVIPSHMVYISDRVFNSESKMNKFIIKHIIPVLCNSDYGITILNMDSHISVPSCPSKESDDISGNIKEVLISNIDTITRELML